MADRRRINAPPGGTVPPIFANTISTTSTQRPKRTRQPTDLRKVFLRTGLVPSASGSSYLELHAPTPSSSTGSLVPSTSSLKLTCTVHGPRPLPRNAAFSSTMLLTTHVKFAPFATRQRRGYLRDAAERDLGVHLEAALRGVVIGERWPKSACEVVITVLEGEEDRWWGDEKNATGEGARLGGWGLMNVLAGAITAASAAIADAGIDCVDLVAGGVAAEVGDGQGKEEVVLDPCPSEHERVGAACVVGYLGARDELTEVWMKGDGSGSADGLIDRAVEAAALMRTVLAEAVREGAMMKYGSGLPEADGAAKKGSVKAEDVAMTG
ncbi:3'-5'-exoribonuclease [Zalaria obscura]|uniref:3'-5'-exoribonuclease n=1 Tax=Zalaria obscura TaxID=2024903 RepID=A0ACC3SL46_9PEZI